MNVPQQCVSKACWDNFLTFQSADSGTNDASRNCKQDVVEAVQFIPQEPVQNRTKEQIVNVPVAQFQEAPALDDTVKTVCRRRLQKITQTNLKVMQKCLTFLTHAGNLLLTVTPLNSVTTSLTGPNSRSKPCTYPWIQKCSCVLLGERTLHSP